MRWRSITCFDMVEREALGRTGFYPCFDVPIAKPAHLLAEKPSVLNALVLSYCKALGCMPAHPFAPQLCALLYGIRANVSTWHPPLCDTPFATENSDREVSALFVEPCVLFLYSQQFC